MLMLNCILISAILVVSGGERVKITTYYESLCPYSQKFIVNQLYPTFELLKSDLEIKMVPYGNAEYFRNTDGGWNFTCQHGPRECMGNKIHACVIHYYSDGDFMPFLECSMGSDDAVDACKKCALDNNLDWNTIHSCAIGDLGSDLLYTNAVDTDELEPPITGVPHVLINDIHDSQNDVEMGNDLMAVVCRSYQEIKPRNCPNST